MCRELRLKFDAVTTLGDYEGELRAAILRMKRPGVDPLTMALAESVVARFGEKSVAADVVVAIPMHWTRRIWRGTNSSDLVASVLAGRLCLPVAHGLLVRRRNTRQQAALLRSERIRNVRNAFFVRPVEALRGARVLLVDDVLTTGATASEAARVLKQAGAAQVSVAVLARAHANP